ncbi:MAG: hypothetical protein NZ867_01370 [SAR324 cluster bacterium]|nr:hypothetical protein [SAR324 cluster bacterium]
MCVGMAMVMLFLLLMIVFIAWVKNLTRNYTILQLQALQARRKFKTNTSQTDQSSTVPIEVFAGAITSFESDDNTP